MPVLAVLVLLYLLREWHLFGGRLAQPFNHCCANLTEFARSACDLVDPADFFNYRLCLWFFDAVTTEAGTST